MFRKIFLILQSAVLLAAGSGCDLTAIETSQTSQSKEELEAQVPEVALEYLESKYGISFEILRYNGADGAKYGGESYYLVCAKALDEEETEFTLNVYTTKKEDGTKELYVKSDYYYGYYIEDRMLEWMRTYLDETPLTDYWLDFRGMYSAYPAEYSIDMTPEELMVAITSIDSKPERPHLLFEILISETERNRFSSMESVFSSVKEELLFIGGTITLEILVFTNCNYEEIVNNKTLKIEQDEKSEVVEEIVIIDC